MKSEVSQEAIGKTTCYKNYACLQEGQGPNCEVIGKFAELVLHTFNAGKSFCSYCEPFSDSEGYCWCPVRVELYDRYDI